MQIKLLSLPVLFLLLFASDCIAADTNDWLIMGDSGVVLEYQPDMAKQARQLLPELVKIANDPSISEISKAKNAHDMLSEKKKEYLQTLSQILGMDKPSDQMNIIYDSVRNSQKALLDSLPDFRHYKLWRQDRITEALRSGVTIPGFAIDSKDNDVILTITSDFNQHGATVARMNYFPIIAQKDQPFQDTIKNTRTLISGLTEMANTFGKWMLLHEVAEVTIISDVGVETAFRRWFCEGMAQCAAEETLKKHAEKSAVEDAFKRYDLKDYEGMQSKVDLIGWRGLEFEKAMPVSYSGLVKGAYYTFAVNEARGLVKRHGTEVIAKIMKRLSACPVKDSAAILQSIKDVTGEDMEAALSKYGSDVKDNFRGVAIKSMSLYLLKKGEDGEWMPEKLAPGTAVVMDGKHEIGAILTYETLNSPLKLNVDVKSPDSTYHGSTELKDKVMNEVSLEMGFCEVSGDLSQGDGVVQVYFNGGLFKEVPIKLVAK